MKLIVAAFVMSLCFSTFGHTLRHYPEAPLRIIEIGHPTLRMKAEEVPHDRIQTNEIQRLLDDMADTMKQAGGVGLAAPQVNVSKRIFVMKPSSFKPVEYIINPKVEYLEQFGKKKSTEGCLSIPGKRVTVERYKRLNLSYFNRHGEQIAEEASGFRAIVAQHEYDHLNGVMIVDLETLIEEVDHENFISYPLM